MCVRARTCTHDEAQLLVVACVHGLALLHAAAVVGLALHIEGDPPQLEDDVPLGLQGSQQGGQRSSAAPMTFPGHRQNEKKRRCSAFNLHQFVISTIVVHINKQNF